MLKMISFNVNGFRAILKKDFQRDFDALNADIFAIQESKVQPGQHAFMPEGYHQYWNYAEKKGYSGTAIFSKKPALDVYYGIGVPEHDREGRVITLDFGQYYFVTTYTPNAQDGLRRLDYRVQWEEAWREYLHGLSLKKGLILCGDLNVAHNEIDLTHPESNRQSPGFSDREREAFRALLAKGFVDTFRHFYPEQAEAYTWWSYRTRARERNVGWRIDYFLVSERLKGALVSAAIRSDIFGSDHCPVELCIDLPTDELA